MLGQKLFWIASAIVAKPLALSSASSRIVKGVGAPVAIGTLAVAAAWLYFWSEAFPG